MKIAVDYVDEAGRVIATCTYEPNQEQRPPATIMSTPLADHRCMKCSTRFRANLGPVECPECGHIYVQLLTP